MRADPYSAPEEDIARLQRQRGTKLMLVIAGLVAAVIVMIAASALMYSDDSDYRTDPANSRR